MLHGPGDLRLEEVPAPRPGPGEVVLRVDRALTCATDAKMLRRGSHPALPPPPAPFGHEAAGTVAAVGAGVRGVREGDAVVVANSAPCDRCRPCRRGRPGLCARLTYLSGAHAEMLRVPAPIVRRNTVPLPPGLDPALAAMTEPVACALRGAERLHTRPDDRVLVLGAGIQGLVITAALARRGCRVVACDPHPERRELARAFGADAALDAPRDPARLAAVREALGGGADVSVAAHAGAATIRQAFDLTARGGEMAVHGGPDPGVRLDLPAARLHYDEITVQASYHHTPATVRGALALIAEGSLPLARLLGPEIDLEEVPEVLRAGGPKRPVRPV